MKLFLGNQLHFVCILHGETSYKHVRLAVKCTPIVICSTVSGLTFGTYLQQMMINWYLIVISSYFAHFREVVKQMNKDVT